MTNDSLKEKKLREQLGNCNFEMAKSILIKNFSGSVIPNECSVLLDQYVTDPCIDTAIKLLKLDSNLIAVFKLSRGEGFTEFLLRKGDIK